MSMLQSLVAFAQRKGLAASPTVRMAGVAASINLTSDGRFTGMISTTGHATETVDLLNPKRSKRERIAPILKLVPNGDLPSHRTGLTVRPFFLCDNSTFVLGKEDRGYEKIKHPALTAIISFYDNPEELAKCLADPLADEIRGNLGFRVNGEWVTDIPEIITYWEDIYVLPPATSTCLVCGNKAPVMRVLPKIKGFPNNANGVSLFSNNQGSMKSWGHTANGLLNAPICCVCGQGFSSSVNALKNGADTLDGVHIDPQSYILGGQRSSLVILFWGDDITSREVKLAYGNFEGNQTEIKDIFDCVFNGGTYRNKTLVEYEEDQFFAVIIDSPRGRFAIRTYYHATMADFYRNVAQFLKDSEVFDLKTNQTFHGGINVLVESIRTHPKQNLGSVAEDLTLNMLMDRPYPSYIGDRVLDRFFAEPKNRFYAARLALLRLTMVREARHKKRFDPTYTFPEIGASMNPELEEEPYLVGRLLAIAEEAQRLSSRVATTITDRYIYSMATSPGLSFTEFLKHMSLYLRKKRNDGGLVCPGWLLDWNAEVWTLLARTHTAGNRNTLPNHYNRAQSKMVLVGYSHQVAAIRNKWNEVVAQKAAQKAAAAVAAAQKAAAQNAAGVLP